MLHLGQKIVYCIKLLQIMRKQIINSIFILVVGSSAMAQNQFDFDNPSIEPVNDVLKTYEVVSNHSVSVILIGAEYSLSLIHI